MTMTVTVTVTMTMTIASSDLVPRAQIYISFRGVRYLGPEDHALDVVDSLSRDMLPRLVQRLEHARVEL